MDAKKEIKKRDKIIISLQKDLKRMENWGLQSNKEIITKDKTIRKLQNDLKKIEDWGKQSIIEIKIRDKTIRKFRDDLKKTENWGKQSQEEIKQRDRIIKRLQNKVKERLKMRMQIRNLRRDLSEKESKLNSIYNSKAWKLISYYRKSRNMFKLFKHMKPRIISSPADLKKSIKRTKKVVFIFPIINWDFRMQRPQQLARQIAKDNTVIYFSTEITRIYSRPKKYDDILYHLGVIKLGHNIFSTNLVSYNDLSIYNDVISTKDKNLMKKGIKVFKRKFNIKKTVSFVNLPFWYPLVKNIKNNKIIYDCMDEHSGFSTTSMKMIDLEKDLIKKSKLVIYSSHSLFNKNKHMNKNSILLKNACDFEHFNKNSTSRLLKKYKKPVIGYYGAISDWFDVELIKKTAKAFPKARIVLIGHTMGCKEIKKLKRIRNIHLLGEKNYKGIPSYLHGFDVALIPFKINKLTKATNPVKFYEYMCQGKPVVSTNLPELNDYKKYVYLSKTHKEFINNIKKALKDTTKKEKIKFAKTQTWEKRYEVLKKWLQKFQS